MIIGVSESAAMPQRQREWVRFHPYDSLDLLGTGLLVGACDWALAATLDDANALSTFCATSPASAVLLRGDGAGLRVACRNALVPDVPAPRSVTWRDTRNLWRVAWARWIESELMESLTLRNVQFVDLFLAALHAKRALALARALHRPMRTLRDQLRHAGLAPPHRLLLAARALTVWELVRLDHYALEAIALQAGWSGLSAMDHSMREFLGLLPHDLRRLRPKGPELDPAEEGRARSEVRSKRSKRRRKQLGQPFTAANIRRDSLGPSEYAATTLSLFQRSASSDGISGLAGQRSRAGLPFESKGVG